MGNGQHTGKGGGKGLGNGYSFPNPKDEGVLWERDGSAKGFRRIPLNHPCPFAYGRKGKGGKGGKGCFIMQRSKPCNRVHADCPDCTGLNYKPELDAS